MSETFAKVKEVIVDQLNVDEADINEDATFIDDLGADSLDVVELAMALEDEFGLQVPDDDLENIRTVQDIVDYVSKHAGMAS